VQDVRVLVLGITFKENVSDIRNSRVIDLIRELKELGMKVIVCDPHADAAEVKKEYGLALSSYEKQARVDAVIVAVNHAEFKKKLTVASLQKHLGGSSSRGVVIDVKGLFSPKDFAKTKLLYWRL
jgi:UDP-N-acetyl-D-galactosamine dehydrogenase